MQGFIAGLVVAGLVWLCWNQFHTTQLKDHATQLQTPTSSGLTWPDTTAPDKTDPFWEFNNNLNYNGTPYHKVEDSSGRWEWKVDEKLLKEQNDMEQHRRNLYQALRTRVLTDAEVKEALQYGDYLNVEPMVSYREEDKRKELNDAFYQQARLKSLQH